MEKSKEKKTSAVTEGSQTLMLECIAKPATASKVAIGVLSNPFRDHPTGGCKVIFLQHPDCTQKRKHES